MSHNGTDGSGLRKYVVDVLFIKMLNTKAGPRQRFVTMNLTASSEVKFFKKRERPRY